MFFKPEMREAILAGRKSETRRIWKRPHVKVGGIYKVRKGRYSREFYFRIKVLAISKQRLGDMTEEDAIEEGFSPKVITPDVTLTALENFMDYWYKMHGSWNPDQEVYVVRFEKVVD